MQKRRLNYLIPVAVGIILVATFWLLRPAPDANAQCGSQASSCKNCHEVQGKDPVNNDGTGWHQGHAFGDFCYICHAGNNQSMVEEEAHTGMVDPISDVQAACAGCHPDDLMERSQVYATALGVEIGMGGSQPPSGGSAGGESPTGGEAAPAESASAAEPPAEIVTGSAEVIDYNQQYNETVLGQRTINWGNVILAAMILMVAVGGGAFIYYNERKRRGLPLRRAPVAETGKEAALPHIEGYSPEVVALLPRIAQLNPVGLHALKRLLENPDDASELLQSLSRLDPDLIRRIRALDRDSRAMLMALSGD